MARSRPKLSKSSTPTSRSCSPQAPPTPRSYCRAQPRHLCRFRPERPPTLHLQPRVPATTETCLSNEIRNTSCIRGGNARHGTFEDWPENHPDHSARRRLCVRTPQGRGTWLDSHSRRHEGVGPREGGAAGRERGAGAERRASGDRKSTRLNSSHLGISYAVFCLKKKKLHYAPRSNRWSSARTADQPTSRSSD